MVRNGEYVFIKNLNTNDKKTEWEVDINFKSKKSNFKDV